MKVKRVLSAILAVAIVFSTFSFVVFADGEETSSAVAKISDKEYDTIADAITAAEEGDTILIITDIIEFPEIKKNNLTFKATLPDTWVTKLANTGAVGTGTTFDGFVFKNTGPCVAKDLTIKNCKFQGSNGIYYGACSGEWLIENCEFNNNVYGLQIGEGSGIVNVNNCTFVGGFNTFGSGFELNFNNCTFTTTDARGRYAVFQTHGKMALKDCLFDASWPTDLNSDGSDNGYSYVGNAKSYAVTELYNTTYAGGSIYDLTSKTDGGIFVVDPTVNNNGLYTGGTFLIEPSVSVIADGYKVYEDGEGYFEVRMQLDAAINEAKYKTLSDAVAAAETGDTITLVADIKLDETIQIAEEKNFTLDLAGKKITVAKNEDRSLYAFVNEGTLVLEDSVGGGSITARGVDNYGTFTMNSGTIIACDTNGGYGVWNREGAVFTMNGGTAEATYRGNYSDQYGPSCLRNESGATMTINDGVIKSNNMRAYAVSSKGTLTIENAVVTGFRGVAVDGGSAVIKDGTFTALDTPAENWAPDPYYALYVSAGEVTVKGGTFDAGRYSVNIGGTINITGGYFNAPIGSNEENYSGTVKISGGYFTADVSAYLAEGKKLSPSKLQAYAYEVTDKSAGTVDATVAAGASKSSEAVTDESFGDTGVQTSDVILAMSSKDSENTTALVGAANTVEIKETDKLNQDISNAAEVLGVEEESVQLVKKPYLEIQKVEVTANSEGQDGDTLKYTVKAMYDTVVTAEGKPEVIVGEAEILEVTEPVTMMLPVPDDIASEENVIVKHKKDNGQVFYYIGTVINGVAEFVNPNGFSTFEILPINDADVVATVGDSGFAALQEAVEYIDNNGTVTVVSGNAHVVNLTESKTFTVVNQEGAAIKVTVNGTEYTIENTESEEITYTKPVVSGPTGGGGSGVLYTVVFETNGGGVIKSIKTSRNKTIKEPNVPEKAGYTFDGWYKDKELTKKFDFETNIIIANTTLYAKWIKSGEETDKLEEDVAPTESQSQFADVDSNVWYFDAVKFVTDNKLMNGVSGSEFAPNSLLTRGMLVTILYRNEGEPATEEDTEFDDVEDSSYYEKAVTWAQTNGIVNGVTGNLFAPNANITREQIATIIYRYAEVKGMNAVNMAENLIEFADSNEISEYAVSALNWAVGCGLINGKTPTTLNPQDNATRAEIATILQRFIEMNK